MDTTAPTLVTQLMPVGRRWRNRVNNWRTTWRPPAGKLGAVLEQHFLRHGGLATSIGLSVAPPGKGFEAIDDEMLVVKLCADTCKTLWGTHAAAEKRGAGLIGGSPRLMSRPSAPLA